MKKANKLKNILIVTVALALTAAGYCAFAYFYYYAHAPLRRDGDMSSYIGWRIYAAGMRHAYESDTYGGKTPEETLALYVDALKKGNTDLAAKYYIPEKQLSVAKELAESKEKNNLEKYKDHISAFMGGRIATSTNIYFIFYTDPNSGVTYDMQFVENKLTNIWKISEP